MTTLSVHKGKAYLKLVCSISNPGNIVSVNELLWSMHNGVAGENIVTNNNLGKNNLSITTYAITTW